MQRHNLLLNVLLCDDDDDDYLLFKDALAEIDPEITLSRTANGKILLELLLEKDQTVPDIIFLDVNMPIKNGIEALSEIKSVDDLKQVPVIICSTSTQSWAVDKAHALGANFFIQKPETYSSLKKVLERFLTLDWHAQGPVSRENFLFDSHI